MTGSTLVKDPKTGFLTHSEAYKVVGFTPAMKLRVLEYLEKDLNIANAAKVVGICRRTLDWHIQLDEEFSRQIEDIRQAECDNIEVRVLQEAKKKSFMDRMAWLRAHRPEKWGERKNVVHSFDKVALESLHKRSEVVDIEAVSE